MSNAFKQNSRFAALVEDNPTPKKDNKKQQKNSEIKIENKEEHNNNNTFKENDFNSFKNRDRETRFRPYDEKERQNLREKKEVEENKKKEKAKFEKEKFEKESLKIDNFPTLGLEKSKKEDKAKLCYVEKIKLVKQCTNNSNNTNNIDLDLVDLKPGWVLLKRDPITRRTIIKSHPEKPVIEKHVTEQEIGKNILKSLVDLYEKRTQEYIDTYGYDTWEKMFKSPNWREEEAELGAESDEEEHEEDDDNDYDENEYEAI
jgi:hypothetical protein